MKSSITSPKDEVQWSEVEHRAWQRPKAITVSEWTDENRYLDPLTSAEPGQWMTDRTPYLKGIMDAFIDPMVEDITIMASTQVGKTESMFNMLGYAIDQDPAPTLWVMPREPDARAISSDRIEPMIKLSPTLRAHMTDNEDDITRLEIKLDRMVIYFAGANSPAALAQKPIRYLFLDETDKYPRFSGREADPVKLASERTRTFWNRKIVKCSTPTTRDGYIFREYERSDQCRYFVPCPYCRHYQALVFGQLKWPEEERDPEVIKDQKLAWYGCVKCKQKIRDIDKHKIMLEGLWVPEGRRVEERDRVSIAAKRGFWINAIYSPWLSFSEVVAEFLRSQGSVELLMNFVNSWLAEIWEERALETSEKKIVSLEIDYPPLSIPEDAVVLTAGVDVQKDHFYYVIRAWGAHEESWLIRALRVESWDELITDIFKTEYFGEDGFKTTVRLVCIDSGFRTDEVYELCRAFRDRARATKGIVKLSGVPYIVSKIDRKPKTGEIIKEGLSLFRIDTTYFKDKVARFINSQREDRTHWHIYKGVSEQYVKQLCSEHKVIVRNKRKGQAWEEWQLKGSATPNHFWDCEVMAAAAAEMIRVSVLKPDDVKRIRIEGKTVRKRTPETDPLRGSADPWNIGRTSGWLER